MGLNNHSLVLINDGIVKGFGYNGEGELGLGNTTTPYTSPILIPNISNVKQISCGQSHSLLLLNDGTVKSFGSNSNGELGLGITTQQNTPILISGLSNVKQVIGGQSYSLVLLNNGTVYGFGRNSSGQLGLGNTISPYTSPTLIPSLTNVKQISCGSSHSLALLNDGTVYGFGGNYYGQLGLGNNTSIINTPTLISGMSNVKQISCGTNHSLALLTDGTVKSFGRNIYGNLGLNNTNDYNRPTLIPSLSDVSQITCGADHSLVLLNDGTVKGFGANQFGNLGLGNTTYQYNSPTLITGLTNVKQISGGGNYSVVLLNDGTVKGFGDNTYGQLGLGNTTSPCTTPTLITTLSNVVLLWDNIVVRTRFVMFVDINKVSYSKI